MKVRQNYTNLYLAQLFHCSVLTISNIVTIFIQVLHSILLDDLITIPFRDKNRLSTRELNGPSGGERWEAAVFAGYQILSLYVFPNFKYLSKYFAQIYRDQYGAAMLVHQHGGRKIV